jgi:pantoate--beta-alanine ligase
MHVTHDIPSTRQACSPWASLALVPTMGALHDGHLSLIRHAASEAEHVAVSLFVNPTQFGPTEDLDQYPRPLEKDLALCEAEGVDLAFCPTPQIIYPDQEIDLVIDVPSLTQTLEGARRPGHFVGVCRVVAKLLSIFQPTIACFGQKDFQQLRVIEAMVEGLNMPVRIDRCPTLREPDGLAMSSRNIYLDANQRIRALGLHQALTEATTLIDSGQTDPIAIESAINSILKRADCDVEYAVVRDAIHLGELNRLTLPAVCLIAARVDHVRLIDNAIVM